MILGALALGAAAGARATVRVGTAVDPNAAYVSPITGIATISGDVFCTEPATATVSGTLMQHGISQTTTSTFACGEITPFTLTFEGFRPGPATFQITATACNAGGCDTSSSTVFGITLHPQR